VIYIQHDGDERDAEWNWLGSEGWTLHREMLQPDGEPVIHKTACDAFWQTGLQEELAARGADRLVIAGLQTEYCIDTTCRAAVALGYDVILAGNAHTTEGTPHLSAAQIVAHHNALLNGFGAGNRLVAVRDAAAIDFVAPGG
jgi:nicotinamidase-related amidase